MSWDDLAEMADYCITIDEYDMSEALADYDVVFSQKEKIINELKAEIKQHRDIFSETRYLCMLITGSPPETQIKGKIESLAFNLGHWPQILNALEDKS